VKRVSHEVSGSALVSPRRTSDRATGSYRLL